MSKQVEEKGFIRGEIARFWAWYESNYKLNVSIAALLFGLQLVHLVWLTLDVAAFKMTGNTYFPQWNVLESALIIVDWFEIPALISVSLLYINEFRKKGGVKPIMFLAFLNSQWIHILWITDEFVVGKFSGVGLNWPIWLAWVAIAIDYLELPVIFDTLRRLFKAINGEEDASIADILREKDDEAEVSVA